MIVLSHGKKNFWRELKAFCDSRAGRHQVEGAVREIIAAVRDRGDAAVLEFTKRFDGADLSPRNIRVPLKSLEAAANSLPATKRKALTQAIRCVRDFHKKTLPRSWKAANPHGAQVGERFYPIRRVGLYIPGGQVPLVSTVIMSAVLANIAGVPEIAVCTPPQKNGQVDSSLLAALYLCGVREVYKVGGVQAIAAMAHGTKTIPAVDKIFGPGNAYVMEAKRQLFGVVGMDLLPGPSEVLVVGDETAKPAYMAADILAQAEHGTGKEKVYLIVPNRATLDQVVDEIEIQLQSLSHREAVEKVLQTNFLVVIAEAQEAVAEVANFIAPEHMELQVSTARQRYYLDNITTAGAILLGHETPTVLGDFTAGPSHTLPTDRTGRFFSGMQVSDFMRRSSIVQYDRSSAEKAWPTVRAFSLMEQLDAHGKSLGIRVGKDL